MFKIRDVNTKTIRWSTRVMVDDKTEPRQSTIGGTLFQIITFIDQQEQKVEAVIYDDDINFFESTLRPFHTYIISNARVIPIADEHNLYDYPYKWVIKRRTEIYEDAVPLFG